MDQNQTRMFLAIALSLAILLGWQFLLRPYLPHPAPAPVTATQSATPKPSDTVGAQPTDLTASKPSVVAKNVPRIAIDAPSVQGSISLVGARLDELVLRDYHEEVSPKSPLVQLLSPASTPQPYYVQWGWTAAPGTQVKLPDSDTLWTAQGSKLTAMDPVTLSWNNGEGLVFQIKLSVDDHYMFQVQQSVRNDTGAPVSLYPWSRVSRDYTPVTLGYYLLHEGPVGVLDGTLKELNYKSMVSEGKGHDGVALTVNSTGGWAGFTDKYWLVSLVPNQQDTSITTFRAVTVDGHDGYQVANIDDKPQTIAPGASAAISSHVFAGAKVVNLLDHYESDLHVTKFHLAVDFGWFWFLTIPIFYALDWLNSVLGNFGLAIMAFTVFVKALFFPLANKSYRSMSKMRLLAPKVAAMRERFKDEPGKQQSEMMALYKAEGVNPASGCLPMVVQIPVFFSLYKDIFVTIEMRHAPFFGWIHDLSAVDPTNIFTLFGLIHWDPTAISPLLHLGIWPIIMGFTMFLQQRLNPPPPDPVQARLFQFMPLIFTFMLARFPAGLVIYWSWNNTLTVLQQWVIMRRVSAPRTRVART